MCVWCRAAVEEGTASSDFCLVFLLLMLLVFSLSPFGNTVWLNLKDPRVAFQDWLCTSSVLPLWKEELVPAVPWAPSERHSLFGSPSVGAGASAWGRRWELLNSARGLLARAAGAVCSLGLRPRALLRAAPAWLRPLLRVLCPGEFCRPTSRPGWGRHVERLVSLGCFCLYFRLLK